MILNVEAGIPSWAVTLTNLASAQHSWLLCVLASPPWGCVKAPRQLSQGPGLLESVQKCCGERGCREHACTELAAAACWQADAAASPAPCSQPFVLLSYQPWHEGALGVSLVYW